MTSLPSQLDFDEACNVSFPGYLALDDTVSVFQKSHPCEVGVQQYQTEWPCTEPDRLYRMNWILVMQRYYGDRISETILKKQQHGNWIEVTYQMRW